MSQLICLLSCPFSQDCWRIADLRFGQDFSGFGDWFFDLGEQLNEKVWGRALYSLLEALEC